MRAIPPSRRAVALVALGVFALAFAVRLAWLLGVQSPLDTVYSDMGGYVDRAQLLLQHKTPADPRVMTLYPPGTHSILALEFLVLGRESRRAIAIAHAFVGALPAPCLAAITVNLVPRLWASALVGTLVALWYPQACFVSYFSSEMWFSAMVAIYAWLTVHDWKGAAGKLATGAAAALAFVIRPQFLLAFLIEIGARALKLVWRRGPVAAFQSLAWIVFPLVLMISGTSARFHKLSGHWGLISESCINRLWADTDICLLTSSWTTPNGERWSYWFNPPSKTARKPSDKVNFEGYIADPVLVDRIRLERLKTFTLRQRIERKLWNISLLVAGNLPWPESNYKEPPWRLALQKGYATALLYGVLPLAAFGLLLGRRNRTMLILAANLATAVIAAAMFFGEARYNLPYAPFALLLAVVGLYELSRRFRPMIQARTP